ncbi:MAG: copper-binding protein [Gammaproteobacteria bacterium]|nr:copper-binding protein [Gammaproteobacteria bacterium]MBU1443280.1 copper-binding protein [Gammaproteobacteria bacterium]MBU2288729.1 copper-binding protein [Gammaproteobacteria bacterium]MBU2407975.1 copper-binding protein [Gammaproteobacteria bacterium]
MKKLRLALVASAAAMLFSGMAVAQSAPPSQATVQGTAAAAATSDMSDGEIRKVDKDAKKLTIKHGPLKNLDMPGMTMVFSVKDDAVLDQVQSGEKVRFFAEKVDGKITVTKIEAAR